MSGIKPLRKLVFGRETTAGTAVAGTRVWHGRGAIEDTRLFKFIEEDVGMLVGSDESYVGRLGAALLIESTPASFEQFPHILEMSVKKVVTGAADGAGSGKIYTYTFPTTAANTLSYYTIEGGDNQAAEEMEYCCVTDWTLTGESSEAWTVGANVIGRQVSTSAFTTAATLPSVEVMLFQKSKLYIDSITGTYGTTQKSNTLLSAAVTWNSGLRQKYTADGNLYFSFIQGVGPSIRLKLTFEHDGTSTAEKAAWKAQTPRKIRLLCEGSSYTTAGTSYSKKTMIIDVNGKWEKFAKLGDRNGNDILEGEFVGKYDVTSADFGKIIVTNLLTALP